MAKGTKMKTSIRLKGFTMMELLVAHGADVNALWHGHFPIIFAPCESLDPVALEWLLDHGANPNCRDHGYEISGHRYPGTALDYLIAGYARSLERLRACIDVLLEASVSNAYLDAGVEILNGTKTPQKAMDYIRGVALEAKKKM